MEDYDRLCVESWIACGFRVLGINTAGEIPALAARYPGVEFIAAERSAQALFARNTPFIADMMSVLAAQPEPVLGIVNCDLLFEPVAAWQDLISLIEQKIVLTGQRLDVRTLEGGALHQYFPGFDYFFFGREAAAALSTSTLPFSMGLPWWDYWCPLSLASRGFRLQCLASPVVLHLAHESRTDARTMTWRRLAAQFARGLLQDTKECAPPLDWESLVETCALLDSASDAALENGACDGEIIRLSEFAVPLIAGVPVELGSAPATPAPYFADIPRRKVAGQALHLALMEEKRRQFEAARAHYVTATQNAPQDPGVLSSCGNFFFRQGDMERAASLLNRAVEYAPDSAMLLNSLGSALGQIGRDDEALVCFERAVRADPLDGTSYYNLALALYPQNRQAEIVKRLEEVLRQAPHFPGGALWLRRIRENFR
jgi:Tfp pilus assembly protein PilF